MYRVFFKRILDIIAAIIGLIFSAPLFVVILIILMIINNGKPFFFQKRPGKHGIIFNIIKFKTMTDKTDVNGELLPFAERVTVVGNFLRKFSLDEIPQLINVLKGDMSLIGPRPLLVNYLPLYSQEQLKRHNVKPGITGWAQVNGRNAISWEQKFDYDVYYVNHLSLFLDIKILILTIKKVFLREGVNNQQNLNMSPFTGTKDNHN